MKRFAAWTLQHFSALGATPFSRCDAATVVEPSARCGENRVAGNSCREQAELTEQLIGFCRDACPQMFAFRCDAARVGCGAHLSRGLVPRSEEILVQRSCAKVCFHCQHLLAAPPAAKTVSQAAVLRVPKAIAGASGAHRVATAKVFQAICASCRLNNQLSPPAI